MGSGATVSQSLDYGFRSGFSTTTSAGTYASFGLFNAGANGSYTYDLKSRQGSFGWGISGGINLGGNDAWGMGLTIGYGSDGFNYGVGGYFNPKAIKTTLIKEYNLDGASPNALQQRDGYDCLICAVEYIEQGAFEGRVTYEEILDIFGNSYNPMLGTITQEALEKMYGKGNVRGFAEVYPSIVGGQMEQGNPSIIALNKNHAIVPTKIGIYTSQIGNNAPKMKFNISYMNSAGGKFQSTRRVQHYRNPTYLIKFR